MESSYSISVADKEYSEAAALNLSVTTNERRERREEHKNNLVATLVNPSTKRGQAVNTAQANNSVQGVQYGIRNL